jgi:hypothetical protein
MAFESYGSPYQIRLKFFDARDFFFESQTSWLYDPTTQDKMPSTHKRDKPWDTDDIDKWKVSSPYHKVPGRPRKD